MSANNRQRDASTDKASHIHLGPEPSYPMTTSQATYRTKSLENQNNDPNIGKDLRN
jgi:hypothetical protein